MNRPNRGSILLVEDDFDIRDAMGAYLMDEGYGVTPAENGAVALRWLQSASALPCVILLDLSMPVMDGYQFRDAQIKDQRIAAIPTVLISADGQIGEKAARIGISEFLRKPIELQDLLSAVVKHCG